GVFSCINSQVVKIRCEELRYDFHHDGKEEKDLQLEKIHLETGIAYEECALIGDDIWDLQMLTKVGHSEAPADALPYVSERDDYISALRGGQGVFREVGDLILTAKGLLDPIIAQLAKE